MLRLLEFSLVFCCTLPSSVVISLLKCRQRASSSLASQLFTNSSLHSLKNSFPKSAPGHLTLLWSRRFPLLGLLALATTVYSSLRRSHHFGGVEPLLATQDSLHSLSSTRSSSKSPGPSHCRTEASSVSGPRYTSMLLVPSCSSQASSTTRKVTAYYSSRSPNGSTTTTNA